MKTEGINQKSGAVINGAGILRCSVNPDLEDWWESHEAQPPYCSNDEFFPLMYALPSFSAAMAGT